MICYNFKTILCTGCILGDGHLHWGSEVCHARHADPWTAQAASTLRLPLHFEKTVHAKTPSAFGKREGGGGREGAERGRGGRGGRGGRKGGMCACVYISSKPTTSLPSLLPSFPPSLPPSLNSAVCGFEFCPGLRDALLLSLCHSSGVTTSQRISLFSSTGFSVHCCPRLRHCMVCETLPRCCEL